MEINKDIQLYDVWKDYWRKDDEEQVTIVGKILWKQRKAITKQVVESLDITTAIELGCGFGRTLEILVEAKLDYIGIDISEKAISVCKRKNYNVRVGKLEDEMNQYDLVSSEGMLEHFVNFEPYAKHFMRLSKRYVLIMQPNHKSFTGRTLYYMALLLRGHTNIFEYNFQPEDFISVFENNGFKTVENIPISLDTSRLLLFERK